MNWSKNHSSHAPNLPLMPPPSSFPATLSPDNCPKQAVILAGGLGTRLQSVVADLPKPMAPVAGKPFLAWLLDRVATFNIQNVTLAVGYKHEAISQYFGDQYGHIHLSYSIENEPLGTGGAIKKALQESTMQTRTTPPSPIFVLNGDTLFTANLYSLYAAFAHTRADLAIALCPMTNFDRYGTIEIDEDNHIKAFHEKKQTPLGFINGGIYLLKPDLLDNMPTKFSFENDFLAPHLNTPQWIGYVADKDAYFIDIGIPYDYRKAQHDFSL